MQSLRVETLVMPAAELGGENPLPMLAPRLSATAAGEADASVPPEDRRYLGYGLDEGWLPHRGQDDYNRDLASREFAAIVLENDVLRATFLPQVGGRLWSLVHKPSGRDLLFANPVFQPGNLAVRGAWVTGGVEWNACVYGHAPHTCSPLFAAAVEDEMLGPVLRMYEWDRSRGVPFQLDFLLPAGSPVLLVRVRLINPHDATVPMYWWSNIAVSAAPGTRVLAPAHAAYTYDYWGPVKSAPAPHDGERDYSYPSNIPYGADYFFRIADGARPWITALDREGRGIVQTSTARQIGRKLFAWGSEPGGQRWQDFLSAPGQRYFEIQAGLSRTQLECAPMPAGAQWEWMEAYGLLEADPARVHGPDWSAAVGEVEERLERLVSRAALNDRLRNTEPLANKSPRRILHRGSGWGALERVRREHMGERLFASPALPFDDASLTADQRPWLTLLRQGSLPAGDPSREPGAWMVQDAWQNMLTQSVETREGNHWLAHLHLGVMAFAGGDFESARSAWNESLRQRPSAWALRNLAMLNRQAGRDSEALTQYAAAIEMLPRLRPLHVEYLDYLLELGMADEVLAHIDGAPAELRAHSRVKFLEARAGLALGLLDRCDAVLRDDYELVDIREGESSLTDFWIEYAAADFSRTALADNSTKLSYQGPVTVPARLDFRVAPHPQLPQSSLDGQPGPAAASPLANGTSAAVAAASIQAASARHNS